MERGEEDVARSRLIRNIYGSARTHGGLRRSEICDSMSSGNTNKQIVLQDMGVTLLVATPSYALHLEKLLKRIDPSKDLKESDCSEKRKHV